MAKIYYIAGPAKRTPRIGTVMFNGQPITWQSQPVYDTWGPNFNGYWNCGEWMAWHVALTAKYGLQQANLIWYTAWINGANSFGASTNDCKFDSQFTNYLVNVGLLNPNDFSLILPNILNAGGTVVNQAGTIIENTASAAGSISKLLLPAGLIALGFGAYYLIKKSKKA